MTKETYRSLPELTDPKEMHIGRGGMSAESWSRKLRDCIFNCKQKSECANWKKGEAVSSQSPSTLWTVPLTGYQVFKYLNLWGTFLFQNTIDHSLSESSLVFFFLICVSDVHPTFSVPNLSILPCLIYLTAEVTGISFRCLGFTFLTTFIADPASLMFVFVTRQKQQRLI